MTPKGLQGLARRFPNALDIAKHLRRPLTFEEEDTVVGEWERMKEAAEDERRERNGSLAPNLPVKSLSVQKRVVGGQSIYTCKRYFAITHSQ